MPGSFRFAAVRVAGRSVFRGAAIPVMGVAITVGLVVAVQRQPASGAFTATTGAGGNSVTTATNFCTSPGTVTLAAAADNSVAQSGADALPTATDGRLRIISRYTAPSSLNQRAFIRFDLTGTGARRTGCTLSATLKLFLDVPAPGRTLDAHLVDTTLPLWAEAGFRYSTQPATVAGTAVGYAVPSTTPAYASWNVTASVLAQYGATHNGFMIRDRNEDNPVIVEQVIISRDNPNSGGTLNKLPELVLVWS